MDKIFCLGELYDNEDKGLIDYKLNNATEYEQMKNTYINEIYKNNNSKITVYNLYRKNILNWEKILNKDLIYFTVQELDSLISSLPSSSIHIKSGVYSFTSQYLDWAISKKFISMNNIKALDRKLYCEISQKLASSRLISEERLWELIKLWSKNRTIVSKRQGCGT